MTEQPADNGSWREFFSEGRLPVFLLLVLGEWLVAADSLVTVTIMPSVGRELSGYAWFGWATSAYLIGVVVAGGSAGWLSGRIGLRSSMAGAGLVYGLGCLLSAWSPSIELFVTGRAVQGIGGGWVLGFGYVLIARLFPEKHLPRMFAAGSAVWGIATLLGPLVGGLFAEAGFWRGVFYLFAGQGVFFALASLWLVPGARDAPKNGVPLVQILLLTAGIFSLASAGVIDSILICALLVGLGFGLLGATVVVDRKAKTRILPLAASNLRSAIGSGYATFFFAAAAGVGFAVYGPAILQFANGLTPLEAGYVVAIEALSWTVLAIYVANFSRRTANRSIILGNILIASAIGLLALTMGRAGFGFALTGAAILGAGFGMSHAFLNQRVIGALSADESAIGSGAVSAVRYAGGALGAALAAIAANATGLAGGPTAANIAPAGFWIYIVGLPLALIAIGAAALVVRADADA
jgi:MFS family permease